MTIASEFAQICAQILTDTRRNLASINNWKQYLNSGGGERAIAGDHQGRHLLELLQNARDAVFAGGTPGRVFVGVTEQGLIVGNTGAGFDLLDSNRRDSVMYLGRSDKHGKGYVGHKGIGLKSVLLRGGAFHIRSHVRGDVLRARFSRSATATRLLESFAFRLPELRPLVARTVPSELADEPWELVAELPRLPMFLQPHPEKPNGDLNDAALLEDLLVDGAPVRRSPEGIDDSGRPTELPAYTTLVYLPFEDPDWASLLESLAELVPPQWQGPFETSRRKSQVTSDKRAKATWAEVRDLDPRILLLLGEVEQIQLCRFRKGKLVAGVRYDITSPLRAGGQRPAQTVQVERRQWKAPATTPSRRFRVFSRKLRGHEEPVRIVVELPPTDPPADWAPPLEALPPFLFYPIRDADLRLPFVIHGPFRVNSSRTELADEDDHNARVFDGLLQLARTRFPDLASARERAIRAWAPWLLAPRSDLCREASGPTGGFAAGLSELLRAVALVPTTGEPSAGPAVLFDPGNPRACRVLPHGASRLSEPCREAFDALVSQDPEAARRAARTLGLGELILRPEGLLSALRAAWADANEDQLAFPVQAPDAVEFFAMICAALRAIRAADADKAIEFVTSLGEARVPILPIRTRGRAGALVRAESRSLAGGPRRARRVVFWRSPDADAGRALPTPPSDVAVFVCDEAAVERGLKELFDYGLQWGTARLQSRRDLFLRVAGELAGQPAEAVVRTLAWLQDRLREAKEGKLSAPESGAWRGWPAFSEVPPVLGDKANAARERYAEVQRLGALQLPTADGGEARARDLVFGAPWVDALATIGPSGSRYAASVSAYSRFRGSVEAPGARLLARPDDPRWAAAGRSMGRLATLLLALGVQAGPPIRWRWVRPERRRQAGERARDWSLDGAIDVPTSRRWSEAGPDDQGDQGPAIDAWWSMTAEARHHPAHSAAHADKCGSRGSFVWREGPYPVAWAWFPDLGSLARGWSDASAEAWIEALLALWPEVQSRALQTAWCCRGNHHPMWWKQSVPSLALAQLMESPLWPSEHADGRRGRARATELVQWPAETDPRQDDRRFALPTIDRRLPIEVGLRLGVVAPEELAPAAALQRLTSLLRPAVDPNDGTAAPRLDIARLPVSWVGAANHLTQRLSASIGVPGLAGGSQKEWAWRLQDLGLREGLLRGHDATLSPRAVPVQAADDAQAAVAASTVVFNRRPRRRDLLALKGRVALGVPEGARAELLRLGRKLGADETVLLEPEHFPDLQAAPAAEREELASRFRVRLPLVLGVLRLRNKEDLSGPAEEILSLLEDLVGVDSGPDDGRKSGLTASRRLAYLRSPRSPEPWVLASGVAEAVGQPGAAPQLDHALSSDTARFEQLLAEQGVEVGKIVEEVAVLRKERDRRRQARREQIAAWWARLGREVPAELVLLAEAASSEPQRLELLGRALAMAGAAATELLEPDALEDAGLARVARRPIGFLRSDAEAALDRWTRARAAESWREGGVDGLLVELARFEEQAHGMQGHSRAAELGAGIDGPRFVASWSQADWDRLSEDSERLLSHLHAEAEGPRRQPLGLLCTAENVADARAALARPAAEGRAALALLDQRFQSGEIAFDEGVLAAAIVGAVADARPIAASRGSGGGGGTHVSVDQQRRGRIAEWFALERCRLFFDQLAPADRGAVLDALLAARGCVEPVPWGTRDRFKRLSGAVREHREALVGGQDAALLRDLLDVSAERGPGFDLLDPFDDAGRPGPVRRVEVKAIDPGAALPRVFMTSNEFHKARLDPDTYVLRLVSVPTEVGDLSAVRLVADIPDPVDSLDLRHAFLEGVSGGRAGLRLTLA